ncbi:uncharacterized protein At2g39795, mitochondrial-like [Phoenix dactylifera]|uniref:Uncharacterized protein At2g39795, mitochondrial-like n=1 Tax=Phoenix dactylifera TaxID=42345 RepID=A0A8B7CCB5_PHODC|nr:uncharacterized protein At2g39795, mitochondrial-like [Phoenix dactylifera]
MPSSIASSLLCRTLRLSRSSSRFFGHCQPLFYSSLASSRSSSPLIRSVVPQILRNPPSLLSFRFASSKVSADENLKRVLDSEINCVLQSNTHGQEIELPDGFPFEIIDNPGNQTVILKREFAGENIQVTVFMNLDAEGDLGENDEDGSEDDNNESSFQPTISVVVSIEKGEGPFLEFSCNLNADELEIESMALKKHDAPDDQGAYQGPEFSDLDENLQKALHKYLAVRGIKGSLFDFLHEYMMSKDEKEYLAWLKNLKEFVGK